MKLTLAEKETIIRISEADKNWNIYTSSKPIMNKIEKFAQPIEVKKDKDGIYAKFYELPKTCIRITKPIKLTDEQKKQKVESGKQLRNAQLALSNKVVKPKDEIKIAK